MRMGASVGRLSSTRASSEVIAYSCEASRLSLASLIVNYRRLLDFFVQIESDCACSLIYQELRDAKGFQTFARLKVLRDREAGAHASRNVNL